MGKEQILSWPVAISVFVPLEIGGVTLIALPDVPDEFGWGMVIVGGIIITVAIFYHVLKRRETKDEIRGKLRNLRKCGVDLRNKGMNLDIEERVESWIKEFTEWNTAVLSVIEKESQAEASTFETLDLMPARMFPTAINERHLLYLRVFTEKLQRLNQIMQRLQKS